MTRIEQEGVGAPIIVRRVEGDLRLRGRAGGRLSVDGDGAAVEHLGDGQPYVVSTQGDCRITLPDQVAVSVQAVGGDAKLTDLGGELVVQAVGGDFSLRGASAVTLRQVGGCVRIKHAAGDVSVGDVGADATIREVRGSVYVANVGADLFVRNVEGSCVVENVGADLVVSLDFAPDAEYRFGAGATILCRVQPATNATFILPPGTEVELDVPAEQVQEDEAEQQVIRIGDGSIPVVITHAALLHLVGEEEDYALNFGGRIEEELEARLSSLEEKLNQQLDGLDERIQARTEQFASQAERWAEHAQRQAAKAAERMAQRMDRDMKFKHKRGPRGPWTFGRPTPPRPPRPSEPVREEERLMILRMVQEGKISIEEAERLLAALE